jgi:hypothetical protein
MIYLKCTAGHIPYQKQNKKNSTRPRGYFFLILRHVCWGEAGQKISQINIILIILDTRLIWNSNLNSNLIGRGGQK